MIAVFLALLYCGQTSGVPTEPPKLVNDGAKASFSNGILELKGGAGWLRTANPLLDFEVTFEIRALTADANPGLILRSWTGRHNWPDRGYRLAIPSGGPVEDVSKILVGRRQKVDTVQKGSIELHPHGAWQTIQVIGHGRSIRVAVNGTIAGEFVIESYGGYLMFENKKGRVELRQMTLRASGPSDPLPADVLRREELKALEGRAPEVLHEVRPIYTYEAMRKMLRGLVLLEAVVLTDGSVGAVRVARSLDPDLDISAAAALKAWRFRPAIVNGELIASTVEVETEFVLR